jgi:hypothetical protein
LQAEQLKLEQTLLPARQSLLIEKAKEACTAGSAMTVHEAMHYALEQHEVASSAKQGQ